EVGRPPPGPCQSRPEQVAKALFRDFPKPFLGCRRAVKPAPHAKHAPVAQLDRALDYESRGQEFESLRARHHLPKNAIPYKMLRIYWCIRAVCCAINVQQNVQHVRKTMSDFLTRRDGTWHFVRRVPAEFARFDRRGIGKHSTKVRIAQDRTGRRAARVADKLNEELELYWKALAGG